MRYLCCSALLHADDIDKAYAIVFVYYKNIRVCN